MGRPRPTESAILLSPNHAGLLLFGGPPSVLRLKFAA
jgi:hypothetical protein